MDEISLQAAPRTPGKGAARAVRREGNVPCVLYGHHVEALPFSTSERSLHPLIYTNRTHLVKILMGDDDWECILKEIAFHPVTDRPLHADFQVLQPGERVTLSVPIRYLGTSIGQAQGGRPSYVLNEVSVVCMPRHIPSQIDVDVTEIGIGQAIHVRDLELENLDIQAPDDQVLMTVLRARTVVEEVEEELDEEVEEIEEE